MKVRIVSIGKIDAHNYPPENRRRIIGKIGEFDPWDNYGNGWHSGVFSPDEPAHEDSSSLFFIHVRVTKLS